MSAVLIPLPSRDFDPSEVAIGWRVLTDRGHVVRFATPDGQPAQADPLMLTGVGLDLWGWIPGLRRIKLLGLALRADANARRAHAQMVADPAYREPHAYATLAVGDWDGLWLPGGHWARGMRAYLESPELLRFVGDFFAAGKPVAAICHGVLLAARAVSPATGRSALHGKRTTALTWKLENSAWTLMRWIGRVWDAGYYRTYIEGPGDPPGHWSVQAEVTRALARPGDFCDVPPACADHFRKASGLFRDRPGDERPAFVVADGNYLSGRWPGDAHTLATRFAELLAQPG